MNPVVSSYSATEVNPRAKLQLVPDLAQKLHPRLDIGIGLDTLGQTFE